MPNPFVSPRALRSGHLGAMTLSVAAHTAFFVMAVVPPTPSPWHAPQPAGRGFPTERVRFVTVAPRARAPEPTKAPTRGNATRRATNTGRLASTDAGARLAFRPLAIAPIVLPDAELADIDLTSKITDSLDFSQNNLADVIGSVIGVKRPGPVNGVYGPEAVEKVVFPFSGNPKPVYPPSLAARSVEATFTVRFVVDSTGRVDEKAAEFPQTANPLFVDSVRRSLARSRFFSCRAGWTPRPATRVAGVHFPNGALRAPERPLVIINSWMWSFAGDRETESKGRIAGSELGGFLYRWANAARLSSNGLT